MMRESFCSGWEFVPAWSEAFARGEGSAEPVTLPHSLRMLPLHYAAPQDYEAVSGYRRIFNADAAWRDKRVFLCLEGAAHIADVFLNGVHLSRHAGGYTAFRTELTSALRLGEENLIAVRLDSTENPAVPPFGFAVDYLTYGGLYREAWLEIRESDYISDIFVCTPDLHTASVRVSVEGTFETLRTEILDRSGKVLCTRRVPQKELSLAVPEAEPWTLDSPVLYTCRCTLLRADGSPADSLEVRFGFRTALFRADGFYLNGEKVFLRGLNRHQSYPYLGYAAPASLQREDARILKEELACNAVRTSHYPQSPHFIDACDELGLLVFTELPGWQHIGDEAWKDCACENLREMVMQYRNHPSVVLWGVRINESQDDDAFYKRTNELCRSLDPSRQTSGVRYLRKSSLLEDVYAFNDFSHDGTGPGVRRKREVMKDPSGPLLVSECNGHMYPTKSFDDSLHRQSHALRHARVQSDAAASGEHCGCFGWCMFDYQTHKDFGSGDRICYHGVMDAFRNPKLAAAVYASQGEKMPVLEVSSSMDIGDYPAGNLGTVWVFSNADEVELYKNDVYVTTLRPDGSYSGLKHPPLPADDRIGVLLESQEGFEKSKARLVHDCLRMSQGGMEHMPLRGKLMMLYAMKRWHLSFSDAVELYGKYVGNWGGEATRWRFDAKKNGSVVASAIREQNAQLHLEVRVSSRTLHTGDTWDAAAVRVRILDGCGMTASYAQYPVRFELQGSAELIGPETAAAEGGMCGTYVRTVGVPGSARLTVAAEGLKPVVTDFEIT